MAITPNTRLKLLKCPLELDNNNQLTFTNEEAQFNYFNSLEALEIENITYQRKDSVIRYPDHIDNLLEFNYCMYQNENYSEKWFYAFITNMRYVSDRMTEITIKTDTFQSWQFQLEFKQSFIEREHTNNDTIGTNTVPESVETGEYTLYNTRQQYAGFGGSHVVMGSTVDVLTGDAVTGDNYSGVYSGIRYYVFTSVDFLNHAIQNLAELSKSDGIVCLFEAPDNLTKFTKVQFTVGTGRGKSGLSIAYGTIATGTDVVNLSDYEISRPNNFNGFTPVNKKLLTYPYNYFVMSNNVGENSVYHYEDFENPASVKFKVYGSITQGCSIRAIPTNYKNGEVWNEGISAGKYPQCSWNTDAFTNWLTQNGVNIGLGTASSIVATGVGLATMNPVGIATGIIGIAQSVGSIYEHSKIPPVAEGNTNNGDITFSKGKNTFEVYPYQIRQEYARIIDNYFSMYGYKTNRLKVPNITGRRNWNYVKTIGANIEAFIPQTDIEEIKAMFNNGVTLWHHTNTFLDYSQNNDII